MRRPRRWRSSPLRARRRSVSISSAILPLQPLPARAGALTSAHVGPEHGGLRPIAPTPAAHHYILSNLATAAFPYAPTRHACQHRPVRDFGLRSSVLYAGCRSISVPCAIAAATIADRPCHACQHPLVWKSAGGPRLCARTTAACQLSLLGFSCSLPRLCCERQQTFSVWAACNRRRSASATAACRVSCNMPLHLPASPCEEGQHMSAHRALEALIPLRRPPQRAKPQQRLLPFCCGLTSSCRARSSSRHPDARLCREHAAGMASGGNWLPCMAFQCVRFTTQDIIAAKRPAFWSQTHTTS